MRWAAGCANSAAQGCPRMQGGKKKTRTCSSGVGEQKICYPRSVTLGLASLLGAPCGRWQDFRNVIMVGCWAGCWGKWRDCRDRGPGVKRQRMTRSHDNLCCRDSESESVGGSANSHCDVFVPIVLWPRQVEPKSRVLSSPGCLSVFARV